MTPDIPPAPPEAAVIKLARESAGMTAESAAEAARNYARAHGGEGISAPYWRSVELGRGGRRGRAVPVRASDRTLALMALITGAAPRQLTAAGRDNAARVLEAMQRREVRPGSITPAPLAAVPPATGRGPANLMPDMEPELRRMADARYPGIAAEIALARSETGTEVPPGADIFTDQREQEVWDEIVLAGQLLYPGEGFSVEQLGRLMAVHRAKADYARSAEHGEQRRVRGVLIPV